jgi:alkylation response protein AidB-like acyl-CoA dehydrogenase
MSAELVIEAPTALNSIFDDTEALVAAVSLAQWWRASAVQREKERQLPERELKELAQSGLLAITVPRAFGGAGVNTHTLAEVIRIIASADPSLAHIPQNHFMGVDNLTWAPEPTRRFFYDAIRDGARFGSAVSERGGKVFETKTTLSRTKGGYVLNGTKYYTTGAWGASWIRVLALHPDGQLRVVLVAGGTPGVEIDSDWNVFGQRLTFSGTTRLTNVFVPEESVLNWVTMPQRSNLSLALAQVVHAALEVGSSESALTDLATFVKSERNDLTLKAVPNDVELRTGELRARVAAARSLVHRASRLIDEAIEAEELTDELSVNAMVAVEEAKAFSYETSVSLTDTVVELIGPDALDERLGLDRHWRNSRVHSLHDPVRWKYSSAGNYLLRGIAPRGLGERDADRPAPLVVPLVAVTTLASVASERGAAT